MFWRMTGDGLWIFHAFQKCKNFKEGESGNPPRFDVVFKKTVQCLTVFDIEQRDSPRSPEMLERIEKFVTIKKIIVMQCFENIDEIL